MSAIKSIVNIMPETMRICMDYHEIVKQLNMQLHIFYNLRILLSTGLMCLRIYNLTQEI